MSESGAELFARYAYPPNALGYCGPADASVLLRRGATADTAIAGHARQFEGAWAYLELIATAAGVGDPLDARVVEAYWLGNDLLDLLDPEDVMRHLQGRFPGQAGASWMPGRAHHGYHVFAVYPWVGLLARRPANDAALRVLQQCRIRWGEVVGIEGARAQVRSRPLVFCDGRLSLGQLGSDGAAIPVDLHVRAGDAVTLHWDWVCDVLAPGGAETLHRLTQDQLTRSNAVLGARSAAVARC